MTEADERESVARIEAGRRVFRKAAGLCGRAGATEEEQAIAAVYAAYDLAEWHAGKETLAIKWLRTAVDVLEQGVFDELGRR